jgi:putative NADPH-quinone reductase
VLDQTTFILAGRAAEDVLLGTASLAARVLIADLRRRNLDVRRSPAYRSAAPHHARLCRCVGVGIWDARRFKRCVGVVRATDPRSRCADVIVIGAAMNNFTVPSILKAWIDQLLRGGRTIKKAARIIPMPGVFSDHAAKVTTRRLFRLQTMLAYR